MDMFISRSSIGGKININIFNIKRDGLTFFIEVIHTNFSLEAKQGPTCFQFFTISVYYQRFLKKILVYIRKNVKIFFCFFGVSGVVEKKAFLCSQL